VHHRIVYRAGAKLLKALSIQEEQLPIKDRCWKRDEKATVFYDAPRRFPHN